MPKNRLSLHDRYIRSMMERPKVNREFFEANLPQKVKEAIDFGSIALQKESFIDDKLRLQIADLLYAANFEGKPGYLYLLLEHASQPDPLLPFRMLKYMVAIMDHHLKKTASKELPVIYPLILYTGNRAFKHSMDLFDLFGAQKALAKDTFTNPYHLVDLTQASDEDLEKYLWFGTAALAAKHVYDSDITPLVKGALKTAWKVIEETGEVDYIYTMITYIIEAGQVADKDEFVKALTTGLKSMSEEKIMRIIDHFKPDIYERGKREGLAILEQLKPEIYERGKREAWVEFEQSKPELLSKAQREALQKVALNLLRLQVSLEKVSEATGLSTQEIETLKMQIH